MIKGHTKIELTNVKTGQKKVIEDTNMVTNGMSNFMMYNPFNTTPFNVSSIPFSTDVPRSYQLCGGLLLFNQKIDEDPDMIFPPEGNKMIGNGVAGISSGNAIPEFGYFDANNSTIEYTGDTTTQKFVFDFGTSQANGEISSVCLSSMLAGYMGFGNHSGQRVAETIGNLKFADDSFNFFDSGYFGNGNKNNFCPRFVDSKGTRTCGFPFLIDYKKNCMYNSHARAFYYDSSYVNEHFSSGTLKLQKYYYPMSSLNPLHHMSSSNMVTLYQEHTVSIPSEITGLATNITRNRNQVFHSYDGTYLIVGSRSSAYLEADDIIYVLHVNADLETKLYTVKNTTGGRLWNVSPSANESQYCKMAVKNGYLICQKYTTSSDTVLTAFKINLTDSTDVVSLGTIDSSNYMNFYLLSNRLFWGTTRIIDLVENVVLKVNYKLTIYSEHFCSICGCDFLHLAHSSISTSSNYAYLLRNPMYLATINNLSEPVVKTSDLTMKITYTLTCTEEGDKQEAGDS